MHRDATRCIAAAVRRHPLQLASTPQRQYFSTVMSPVRKSTMSAVSCRPGTTNPTDAKATEPRRFTGLEERVLRLAASGSERPSTTVEPALRRLARRAGNVLLARRGDRDLTDPRLEGLRNYAASIRLGRAEGLAVFHAAGYSAAQAASVRVFVAEAVRGSRRASPRRERIVYASGLSIGVASLAAFVALTGTLLAGV